MNYPGITFDDYGFLSDDGDDDNLGNVKTNMPKKTCVEKKEYKGSCCRSCGEFNGYAEADLIVNDGCHTCWRCCNHPERKRKGIPVEKRAIFEKYYAKSR
jgi:hypothetical protein